VAMKAKTVTPAEQFKELLPRITTRELYGVAVAILNEGANRAENYADAASEAGAPREIAEEGLAFAVRFRGLWNFTCTLERCLASSLRRRTRAEVALGRREQRRGRGRGVLMGAATTGILAPLKVGDRIPYRMTAIGPTWLVVVEVLGPKSYVVEYPDGHREVLRDA
jgi:hypothetical protein